MSYAELNAKRKQKTFSAFRDPGISAKVDIVETLIRPNIDLMDRLFLRSKAIGQLHHIPQDDHDTRHELMERRAQSEKNSKCWNIVYIIYDSDSDKFIGIGLVELT